MYLHSGTSGHYPKFMTVAEKRSIDWPVNRGICLLTQHNSLIHRPHNCGGAALICLSISCSTSSSVMNKTWRFSSTCDRTFLSGHPFPVENHFLGLAGASLIPATSHSAANDPGTCWRSWLWETNRTTSSAKAEIKSCCSQTGLHLAPGYA